MQTAHLQAAAYGHEAAARMLIKAGERTCFSKLTSKVPQRFTGLHRAVIQVL